MIKYRKIIIWLTMATLLGGIIRLERKSFDPADGLRALIQMCASSVFYSLLSFRLTPISNDSPRLFANIDSGAVSPGAGVICHMNEHRICR